MNIKMNLFMPLLIFLILLSHYINCYDELTINKIDPQIIIIGAGASGIAVASKLFENGFNNITILEAEDRIGGRIYTTKIGEYLVDMGGQWVHGEKNNIVFELAWPLGLLERFADNLRQYNDTLKIFTSSGSTIPNEISQSLRIFHTNISFMITNIDDLKTKSFGEYANLRFEEYFNAHPEINSEQKKSLLFLVNLLQMASDGGNDWYEVSAKGLQFYKWCEGDLSINWKERTYGTILDIIMKKYPDPTKELPILNNTILNSKVVKINYNADDGFNKLITHDGKQYLAQHVIYTGSLGVLKADYEKLFNPPLYDKKISTIKNLGMGHVAKIYLYYDNPWWIDDVYGKCFYWNEADKKEIENDDMRKWMLGVHIAIPIEHKPNLLCLWLSGVHSKDMEVVPEELFRNQTLQLINKFFGSSYNVTQPLTIIRSNWNSNENFRGTYSFRSIASEHADVYASDLAEPIMKDDKPILQFAGEATDEYYSTVHGAINSGFREADRLINYYNSIKKMDKSS